MYYLAPTSREDRTMLGANLQAGQPVTDVYLDYAATTPTDPRVLEVMWPYLKESYGNASSVHSLGRKARFAVEEARETIAHHLGAAPSEILFTSGGTEANNTALHGLAQHRQRLITSKAEHEAVLHPVEALQRSGTDAVFLMPNPHGQLTPHQVEKAIIGQSAGLSIMAVNNEIGTLHDIPRLAEIAAKSHTLVHTDAVQALGLYDLQPEAMGVQALSFSGHKIYGPKGIGGLYWRGDYDLAPFVHGGAQERKRRGGTEYVAGIVGLAKAVDLAVTERAERFAHLQQLQQRLDWQLHEALGGTFIRHTPLGVDGVRAAPHILSISFCSLDNRPVDGEMLLLSLDMEGVYVSSGSACTSGAVAPSHVLQAMGIPPEIAQATVRFSMGQETTEADIDYAVDRLTVVMNRMAAKV